MEYSAILEELLAILEQNNVSVRTEPMGSAGAALCKIKGKQVFFMDTQAGSINTAVACAKAVNEIIDIESIYIKPRVRDFLEKNKPKV